MKIKKNSRLNFYTFCCKTNGLSRAYLILQNYLVFLYEGFFYKNQLGLKNSLLPPFFILGVELNIFLIWAKSG